MGAKPAAGGGMPAPRQQAAPAPAPERTKKPGARSASRYAGALKQRDQEALANVARKKLLGE